MKITTRLNAATSDSANGCSPWRAILRWRKNSTSRLMTMSRRTFLHGAGAAVAPFLESVVHADGTTDAGRRSDGDLHRHRRHRPRIVAADRYKGDSIACRRFSGRRRSQG